MYLDRRSVMKADILSLLVATREGIPATEARRRRRDGKPHHLGLIDNNFAPNLTYDSLWIVLATNFNLYGRGIICTQS
jgi:hypothetical protein